MKNLIKGLVFLSMLTLFSCTKVLYTHQQVLDRYKTKQDVTQKFGVPTEKTMGDSTEEWLYAFQRHDSFTDHSVVEHPNTATAIVANFSKYERCLIFSFDKQGKVTLWHCNGVNFSEKKKDPVATIGLAAGLAAVLVAFMLIIAHSVTESLGGL